MSSYDPSKFYQSGYLDKCFQIVRLLLLKMPERYVVDHLERDESDPGLSIRVIFKEGADRIGQLDVELDDYDMVTKMDMEKRANYEKECNCDHFRTNICETIARRIIRCKSPNPLRPIQIKNITQFSWSRYLQVSDARIYGFVIYPQAPESVLDEFLSNYKNETENHEKAKKE